jgi:undecaprenyl-diphosphatase
MRSPATVPPRLRGPIGAALLVGGALALAAITAKGRGRTADHRMFRRINGGLEHPVLDRFFSAITELGSIYAASSAAALVALRGRRREAADALGAAATTWLVGQGLKKAWRRDRPYEGSGPFRLLIGKPRGTSWPSSHPMVLLAFVTVAGRDLGLGAPARAALNALAGAVGASRVYLGVHYPADVAGGMLLGRAVADVWSRSVSPRSVG